MWDKDSFASGGFVNLTRRLPLCLCRSAGRRPGVQGVSVSGQIQHHVLFGVGRDQATDNDGLEGRSRPRASHDAAVCQSKLVTVSLFPYVKN